ncbi:MAG: hypothetical protein MUD08_17110 [Cytophagales bacterium]|nr:hypothetical protein [Cytophagales bacterium]
MVPNVGAGLAPARASPAPTDGRFGHFLTKTENLKQSHCLKFHFDGRFEQKVPETRAFSLWRACASGQTHSVRTDLRAKGILAIFTQKPIFKWNFKQPLLPAAMEDSDL